jgi:hypothetical protein
MTKNFEYHLSKVAGQVRRIRVGSSYDMHNEALLPWWNKAESLHASALVVWHAYGDERTAISAALLGFEQGFPVGFALQPVFCSLAGLSIEVLLKAILKGISLPVNKTHRLVDLATSTGIIISNDDEIILRSMTEYIYWAGRYPTPSGPDKWTDAQEVFDRQRRKSGSIADHHIRERAVDLDNYMRILKVFAECFWKVRQCTFESVE